MRYLHTHVYVSMQYGWEEKMAVKKEKQTTKKTNHVKFFFLTATTMLPLHPSQSRMAVFPSPVVYVILQRGETWACTLTCIFFDIMNYIHVFYF